MTRGDWREVAFRGIKWTEGAVRLCGGNVRGIGSRRGETVGATTIGGTMNQDKKVAVITGGGSGIGKAAALGFATKGYEVAICGRRRDALEPVREAIGGYAGACDVGDPDAVAAFFGGVHERYGRVDVVFNNAGRFAPATSFGDLDVQTWQEMINTNLNGAFYVAREAFRIMRDQTPQGGRIINNGSISAHVPRPEAASYTTSKHAITGLTKSIALDGRAFGIACGQIDIGNAATDMTSTMNSGSLQANGTMAPEPTFDVQHVVDALLYMSALPLSANVQFMTVMATNMPYIGRG
ncbi:MAG: NAD(P)-dependent dehydrogenase (short-subunit alcohol dehydrogenase family) [Devosia sp.]